ncbi:MAG TPA: sigma-70 family RNA polymerase sigma factor [Gemmataceae bacterium]
MATVQTSPILRYIRQFASSHLAELPDAHLLERFASRRDEAAFTVLVRRHGPLVLGVCRRVLRDGHLAEDCFQTTFLLLARKAGCLRRPEALGPWLYGVALRTARKAKAQAARRRLKESQVRADVAVEDSDDLIWRDLRPVLDESVNALSEKYRIPLVLHYLQGISVTEIARRLRCPRGSVAVRLARAREQLRVRLTRRGLALSAGGLMLALSKASAPASVPPPLVIPTAKSAALVAAAQAAGPGLFPARIAVLMEGVLRIMRTTKGKIIAAVLFVAAFFGAGVEMSAHRAQATKPEDAKDTKTKASASIGNRREKAPRKPRIRFLSLAEARAIALEQRDANQPALYFPGVGLDNLIAAPHDAPPSDSDSIRVLADRTAGADGIVVCGVPQDKHQLDRERHINQILLNIETAYWNVYGSYWQLYSREQALRFAYEACAIVAAKYKVGRASLADFAQAEGQYNLFRSQRLQAIDNLLDNERQLRAMLGLPAPKQTGYELFPAQRLQANDLALDNKGRMWISSGKQIEEVGTRLVPSDAPTVVEQQPDWEKGLAEALKNRPELRLARQDVKLAKEDKLAKKNSPEQRQAQLQLTRASLVLQDQELKTERFLGLEYRRISSAYFQIKAARKQRLAFATQLRVRYEKYRAGAQDATLDLLLEAQRFWADALATEYQAIVTYNNAVCGFEFAKGAIMTYAHVRLAEEPPTDEEEVPAVQRERKRTRSKVRREPAASVDWSSTVPKTGGNAVRQRPEAAISLPSLWKMTPPLKRADELPPVEEGIDADKWLRELAPLE